MANGNIEIVKKLIEKIQKSRAAGVNQLVELLNYLGEAQEREEKETDEGAKERKEEIKAHVEEVTSMELPLDWENVFYGDERAQGVHAESISDGLVLSLNNLGCVDIEYIAAITGEDCKTVILSLRGAIYQNPNKWEECFYKGWESAEEYLSGNLVKKVE